MNRLLRPQARHWASVAPATDQIASLKEIRSVVRLSGADLIHFLQGLLTNDVSKFDQPNNQILYSCLLNAQGRYLHDMFVYRTPDTQPTVLLDTDTVGVTDLLRLLKRYRLRQAIDIDDVSSDYTVYTRFNRNNTNNTSTTTSTTSKDTSTTITSQGTSSIWHVDPRLPALGLRTVLPSTDTTILSLAEHHHHQQQEDATTIAPWEAYQRHRLSLGVAEGDSEIPSGVAIPFEFNVDGLNGISFNKGCYVGQELMARTHFKGVVRKRAMPITLLHQDTHNDSTSTINNSIYLQSGASLYDSETSTKALGKIQVCNGAHGLAILRMGPALQAVADNRPLYVELHKTSSEDGSSGSSSGQSAAAAEEAVQGGLTAAAAIAPPVSSSNGGGVVRVGVKVERPRWWPESWGTEE